MAALDDDAFAAAMDRLGPFERAPLLAVGVSGGADSAALVLLAQRWARARGGAVRALIVDHGLRRGSAEEARRVRTRLRRRGIDAAVLRARLDPAASSTGQGGLQARARERRLELLAEAAARAGALHLLLAHHAEDQAETLLMRRARGDPGDGAVGIPAIRELADIRILRPLLGVRRAALEATCRAARWRPVADPSNDDPRFERVRVRRRLAAGLDQTPDPGAAPIARARAERALARWLAAHGSVDPLGWVALDRVAWCAAEPALRHRLLRAALGCVSGRVHPPRGGALRALAAALSVAGPVARTLHGCRVVARRDVIGIGREPGAVAAQLGAVRLGGWCRRAVTSGDLVPLGPVGRRALPATLQQAIRARGVPNYVIEALPAYPDPAGGPATPAPALLAPPRPLAPAPHPAIVLA